jgi:hypothetical protein
MSPTSMWLVRHGESTWNIAGLAQGRGDEAELTGPCIRTHGYRNGHLAYPKGH